MRVSFGGSWVESTSHSIAEASWCRREGFDSPPPSSQVIGLYIGACA